MALNQQTIVAIAHDSMGRELKRVLGNQLETEFRYDPQGRLAAQRTGKRDQDNRFAPVSQRAYQYNASGQLAQIDDHLRGTTNYHYDALDRLTQVDGPNPETFVHDPAGNILGSHENVDNKNRQQSNGNRLAFYGDNHYTYDERGNRILNEHGKQQSLQQRFNYNALNQLESVENQQQKTVYQYDALGRRISKVNAQSETQFLWLDNTLLSETTTQITSNTRTAKIYLFEPGTHKPLAVVQDSEIYHYHLDHLGTPQEITNSRGKLAWSASFKAYGNLAVVHNNEIENHLRFQGQYYDEETGLHYNRFRYYDPECGRFISQDPIGLLGGANNYQYVPNPTGWVDPLGLSCKENLTTSDNSIPDDYDLMEDMHVNDVVEKNNYGNFNKDCDDIFNGNPELNKLLHQHEFLALRAYTGPNYESMNGVLRGKMPMFAKDWNPVNTSADRALKKLSQSKHFSYDGEVFRGTGMDESDVHKRFPAVGDIYQDKGFTSTTTDQKVAFDGYFKGNIKITAQTKSGIKVDSFSATGGESEILFAPYTKFEITKKELLSDGKTWDIHLKEV